MKDEIKEILDNLNKNKNEIRTCCYYPDDVLSCDDLIKLLDYITNLQEKLKISQTNEETYRLEMQDITKCLGLDEDTIFDEVKEKATNLQVENKKLKEIIKDNTILVQDENGNYQECNINPLDYKSRCEKASELIQFIAYNSERPLTATELNKVYNILQGGDKDE